MFIYIHKICIYTHALFPLSRSTRTNISMSTESSTASLEKRQKDDVDDLHTWYLDNGGNKDKSAGADHIVAGVSPASTQREFFTMYSNDDPEKPTKLSIAEDDAPEQIKEEAREGQISQDRNVDVKKSTPDGQKSQKRDGKWSFCKSCMECFGKCFGMKRR